jgi:hypothetical protein
MPEQGYRLLSEEGEPVTWDPYWERALAEGDVVLVEKKKRASAGSEDANTN